MTVSEGGIRSPLVMAGPGETDDLSEEKPDFLQSLIDAWDRYAEEVGVVPAQM